MAMVLGSCVWKDISMNIVEYYDGITEKDEEKEYKLVKRVSMIDTLFLYFESIKIDEEKENMKKEITELKDITENLTLTILDLLPE